MKINILFYCFFLILLSISCNSDDSENIPKDEVSPAVGVWVMTEILLESPIDNNNDSNFSDNLLDELDCLFAEYDIKQDGTWSSEGNSLDVFRENENQVTFDCSTINNTSGVWILDGNQLNLGNNNTFNLEGNQISREISNDLGFRQITYSKK